MARGVLATESSEKIMDKLKCLTKSNFSLGVEFTQSVERLHQEVKIQDLNPDHSIFSSTASDE